MYCRRPLVSRDNVFFFFISSMFPWLPTIFSLSFISLSILTAGKSVRRIQLWANARSKINKRAAQQDDAISHQSLSRKKEADALRKKKLY